MTAPIEPDSRLAAMGIQLIEIHLWLREELARLRANVDAYLTGDPPAPDAPPAGDPPGDGPPDDDPPDDGEPGPPRPGLPALAAHCVAFCSVLRRHHTGEDSGAFAVLADRFPHLRPVLGELERDHRIVADILRRIEDLIGSSGADRTGGAGPADARRVRAELDGLTALLESHFTYEEKRLVAALNSVDGRVGSAEDLFGVPVPPPE
ncbi:hemerythrin domain-containing protein [Rugosimonospora africana]|uniref:Hemerythrin-like domain-containing protein n=1 Tax=Rugosimonospora africana TaxID=556532 RepID=A0A8J3QVN2_9ACTN|nr:hemerythrin domain-containing protein [Rugosimonospora africana]GIH17688.1 hypothetical protein Raf01_58600 [Rugosimonospora africana]